MVNDKHTHDHICMHIHTYAYTYTYNLTKPNFNKKERGAITALRFLCEWWTKMSVTLKPVNFDRVQIL